MANICENWYTVTGKNNIHVLLKKMEDCDDWNNLLILQSIICNSTHESISMKVGTKSVGNVYADEFGGSFDSAWRMPDSLFKAIIEQNPELSIDLFAYECGCGFGYVLRGSDGQWIEENYDYYDFLYHFNREELDYEFSDEDFDHDLINKYNWYSEYITSKQ